MRTGTFLKTIFTSLIFLAGGLFVLGPTSGCGGGNPYKTVPVSGKVTFDDGSLIEAPELTILFKPQVKNVDAKTYARDGSATVKVSDGTFSCATTYDYGDGLIPGEHKVAVQPMKDGVPARGIVPDRYLDVETSPIVITVEPGMEPLPLTVLKK